MTSDATDLKARAERLRADLEAHADEEENTVRGGLLGLAADDVEAAIDHLDDYRERTDA